jgi:hypothetical protein
MLKMRRVSTRASTSRLAARTSGGRDYPPLLLGGEQRGPLLKGADESLESIVLEVVGGAHLVEVLGKLGCGALEVVRRELGRDFLIRFLRRRHLGLWVYVLGGVMKKR